MASFFVGPDPALEGPSLLPTQTVQTSADTPSPHDLSAAAILATLADSRPPTSHGIEEEELEDDDNDNDDGDGDGDDDDDQAGGILLADESQGIVTAIPYTMTAPAHVSYSTISDAMHSSGNYLYYEMDPSSYDALDQHAAALESLSMEPLQAFSSTAPSSIPEQLMALAPMNQHELDVETSIYDEHPSVQNKETFLDITTFFRHFVAPRKPIAPGLDEIQLPDAITQDSLQGDRYDFQGIDWTSRHSTRASVRESREVFETARMQPKLREVRQVCRPSSTTQTSSTDS